MLIFAGHDLAMAEAEVLIPEDRADVVVSGKISNDLKTLKEKAKDYEFNFENLVFKGGGVKMEGHVGVIKVS